MEVEAVLEANKNLNKKIENLQKEVEYLSTFRERCFELEKTAKSLHEALRAKKNTVRVIQKRDDIPYVLQIIDLHDTSEGMFIEVSV